MVVDKFKTSNGVSIGILDDAFAGVPREEMDRRIRRSQVVAWRIARDKARRERESVTPEGVTPLRGNGCDTSSVGGADSFPSRGSQICGAPFPQGEAK